MMLDHYALIISAIEIEPEDGEIGALDNDTENKNTESKTIATESNPQNELSDNEST